ncbi:hypothetical protein JCM10908_000997 [Rhodotorula pacifica]|uniref:anaphase promoting complex subunit DOC1 n=1 Tax=Rhodotorula pacifica TaxID=1495444 RepID=UPI0031768607
MAEPDSSGLQDIGSLAHWAVSSAKPGYGVENIKDANPTTLWQSEGSQPHLINIQFPKKQSVAEIWLYADISLDDSYTPQKLSVRAGTYHGDLHEIRLVDLPNPTGWQVIKLASGPGSSGATGEQEEPLRAHLLQVAILSNHMNGKDTHVRGIKVLAPKTLDFDDDLVPWRSVEFLQHETIR